jgi:CRP-like cAMP-binding protein
MNYKALSPFASEVPFFRGMSRAATEAVMSHFTQRSFTEGQFVQRANTHGTGLGFISTGSCNVSARTEDGPGWRTVR